MMEETTEKYLATMLEGYEKNMEPLAQTIAQMENQLQSLVDQRDQMETSIAELKELLGLDGEEELLEDNAADGA
jgi:chaperonin cofactor prefoldin